MSNQATLDTKTYSCDGGQSVEIAQRNELPEYAPLLAARHAAHRTELAEIIAELPVETARLVLDVPCGDGFYSTCLADALPTNGRVVAADLSLPYIEAARNLLADDPDRSPICFLEANAYDIPFRNDVFDLAWCAQSLLTLKQPLVALQELRRVVRHEGYVALLEQDRLNEMHLPWPAELADAIHEAERRALAEVLQQHAADENPADHLLRLLEQAGLESFRRSTYAIHREFPLPEEDQTFLLWYFSDLRKRVSPYLTRDQILRLDQITEPESDAYLPRQAHFEMTWQDIVSVGVKR